MTARIDLSRLAAVEVLLRDDGNGVGVVSGDLAGLALLLESRDALLAAVRALNKLAHDAVPDFDAYFVSPSLMMQMDAALSAFDFKEETDHGS